MNHSTIIVADDDKDIAYAIKTLLENEHFEVIICYDGVEVLNALERFTAQLVILDIMMPNLDGLSTAIKIREQYNIPILMLSAKSEQTDKVLGLSIGADDYMTKPFESMEMIARVKALLRRYTNLGAQNQQTLGAYDVRGLSLNPQTKIVTLDGETIKLTATEFQILELLMATPGRVFSAEQIYETVWNEEAYSTENAVMIHISRIREKIEINPKKPEYLKVVWGVGYKIEK